MSRVVLLCGLTCSGKSTHARALAEQGWVWLSVDQDAWDAGHTEQVLPAELQRRIKIDHKRRLREAVAAGRDVVLDYALASRSRRDEYRAIAHEAGAKVELRYFEVPADELRRRLRERNAMEPDPHRMVVPPERLEAWLQNFEPSGPDETDVVVIRPDASG